MLGFIPGIFIHKRTGRADFDAGSAEPASRILEGSVVSRAYHGIDSPVNETHRSDAPGIAAYLDTASAENTEVIIPLYQRFPAKIDRQVFIFIRQCQLIDAYVVYNILEFALFILGATYTPFGNGYITQTDIIRLAALPTVTGQTGIGVFGED
jgi:hypothetical protein